MDLFTASTQLVSELGLFGQQQKPTLTATDSHADLCTTHRTEVSAV